MCAHIICLYIFRGGRGRSRRAQVMREGNGPAHRQDRPGDARVRDVSLNKYTYSIPSNHITKLNQTVNHPKECLLEVISTHEHKVVFIFLFFSFSIPQTTTAVKVGVLTYLVL